MRSIPLPIMLSFQIPQEKNSNPHCHNCKTSENSVSNPIGSKFKFECKNCICQQGQFQIPQGPSSNEKVMPKIIGYIRGFKSHRDQIQIKFLGTLPLPVACFKSHRDQIQMQTCQKYRCLFRVSNPIGTKFKSTI